MLNVHHTVGVGGCLKDVSTNGTVASKRLNVTRVLCWIDREMLVIVVGLAITGSVYAWMVSGTVH